MQKSKISESESSINSRTCLGHLVFFFFCLAPKQKNAAPCIPGAQHTSILALATRFWATSPPLHAFHQIAHWLAPSQVNHNDEEYFFLLLRKIPTQNSYCLWKWCVASNDWCQILVRYKVFQSFNIERALEGILACMADDGVRISHTKEGQLHKEKLKPCHEILDWEHNDFR